MNKSCLFLNLIVQLTWCVLAKLFYRRGQLLLRDLLVLLRFCLGLEPLPREDTLQEVHKDVAQGFHVISAALFDALERKNPCVILEIMFRLCDKGFLILRVL